jgi:hypothetical protein
MDGSGRPEDMSAKRSSVRMFLSAIACIGLAALLIYSMPHGPPLQEPDGSISMATIYKYDRHFWKVYWLFGLGLAAVVLVALGCWRWFRRRKGEPVDKITT